MDRRFAASTPYSTQHPPSIVCSDMGCFEQVPSRRSRFRRRARACRCEVRLPGCTGRAESVHLVGGGNHATAMLEMTKASCLRCHGRLDGGRRPRGGFFAARV